MKKGFTLIELLVVIAIIGILSGIVLTSLNSARSKASDAAVQATLATMRSAAEMVYSSSTPNTYGDTGTTYDCSNGMFAEGDIKAALDSVGGPKYCNAKTNTYVIAVTLPSGSGVWCVDNTGTSTKKATVPADGGTSCSY